MSLSHFEQRNHGEREPVPIHIEIDPNATAADMLESSANLLVASHTSLNPVSGYDQTARARAWQYMPYLISSCLLLGVDPAVYTAKFHDCFATKAREGYYELAAHLAAAHIESGEIERAEDVAREFNGLPGVRSIHVYTRPIVRSWIRRLVYEGDDKGARQLAIAGTLATDNDHRLDLAGLMGALSVWQDRLGKDAEAQYTLQLAWQSILRTKYDALGRAAEEIPATVLPEYEAGRNFSFRGWDKHRIDSRLGVFHMLAGRLEKKERVEDAFHEVATYFQGFSGDPEPMVNWAADCAEAGSLESTLTLKRFLYEYPISRRRIQARKSINLILAKQFAEVHEFARAHNLLAPYPRDPDVIPIRALLFAKQGDVDQAIAIAHRHSPGPDESYGLKHRVLPLANAIAGENPDGALRIIESIGWGWGNDWIGLKPEIDQLARRVDIYTRAGKFREAITEVNMVQISDLTDALFILKVLGSIMEQQLRDLRQSQYSQE